MASLGWVAHSARLIERLMTRRQWARWGMPTIPAFWRLCYLSPPDITGSVLHPGQLWLNVEDNTRDVS